MWCDAVDARVFKQRHRELGLKCFYYQDGAILAWLTDAVTEWLENTSVVEFERTPNGWLIWFLEPSDALLFKLTWGGK